MTYLPFGVIRWLSLCPATKIVPPVWLSWMNTFGESARSSVVRLVAYDTNETNRPSELIEGLRLSRPACEPSVATLTRVVWIVAATGGVVTSRAVNRLPSAVNDGAVSSVALPHERSRSGDES